MKRICNLDGQILYGDRRFAVWCTVTDRFETISGNQTWSSADELAEDCQAEVEDARAASATLAGWRVALHDRVVGLARGSGY